MKSIQKSFLNKKRALGQGMTEYIIIVALIAVAAIGVFSFFGQTISSQTAGLAQELSGKSGTDANEAAQASADEAAAAATEENSLSSYDDRASGKTGGQ